MERPANSSKDYIGYSHSHDEWRDVEEVVSLVESEKYEDVDGADTAGYSLYSDLANRVKRSLNAGRKDDPKVRIEMPFERSSSWGGGIGTNNGQVKKQWREKQVYTITDYRDLDALLGTGTSGG